MSTHLKRGLLIGLAVCLWIIPAAALAQGGPEAVAASGNRFAFDLYRQLRAMPDGGNLIVSPYSIATALTMTCAGARGTTEAQMADVLHLELAADELHPALAALQADLMTVETGGPDEEPLRLTLANGLWGQRGFPFRAAYLDLLDTYYGAGLNLLDFVRAPEAARQTINDWVAEETEDRIQDLLPPGSVDVDTRLVLANAITFKGAWASVFEVDRSREGTFTRLDGTTVTVPMMSQVGHFAYAGLDGYQAIALPYQGGDAAMLILLPEAGRYEAWEDVLDVDLFQATREALASTNVALTMPRFQTETAFSLEEALAGLGMVDAFDPRRADFSGMVETAGGGLYVSAVVHQAFITVDEMGTEAAAATGVVFGPTSAPLAPIALTLDRPFVYAIVDQASGAILFLGRVLDPAS